MTTGLIHTKLTLRLPSCAGYERQGGTGGSPAYDASPQCLRSLIGDSESIECGS